MMLVKYETADDANANAECPSSAESAWKSAWQREMPVQRQKTPVNTEKRLKSGKILGKLPKVPGNARSKCREMLAPI